jgi:PAS domain S-box-containing protein
MAPPRLFHRFAAWAAIALVLAVGAGSLLARVNANARARVRAVDEAEGVAVLLGRDDLVRTAFAWPRGGGSAGTDQLVYLDDFFSPEVQDGSAAKVVLYAPDGVVSYATDRSLLGRRADDAAFVRAALGRPQFRVSGGVEQSAVPVHWVFDPRAPMGVLELQHPYAPVAAEVRSDFLFQAGTTALALLALYLAMLPIMRRVTRTLRRSYVEAARLAAIVDSSNDAIVARDRDGAITAWNGGAERIYGWSADEVLGKPIDVLLPDDAEPVGDELDLTRTVHRRKDGALIDVSVTISPIRDDAGRIVGSALIARDVTELKRLEEELRDAHRQEAVGRLAGGVAQEFGRLLGSIRAAARHGDLRGVQTAADEGSALAQQLQAVGGLHEPRPELLDLTAAVRSAEPWLRDLVGDVELAFELEDDLGLVHADPLQIEQLLLNLVVHARDETDGSGRIALTTAAVDFGRRASWRGAEAADEGHYAMLAVSDTGPGLSPEALARPFEPFLRQDAAGEQLALALAAVSGIVKRSGGTMGVEAGPDGGTTIRVYLPVVGAPVPATA